MSFYYYYYYTAVFFRLAAEVLELQQRLSEATKMTSPHSSPRPTWNSEEAEEFCSTPGWIEPGTTPGMTPVLDPGRNPVITPAIDTGVVYVVDPALEAEVERLMQVVAERERVIEDMSRWRQVRACPPQTAKFEN